MMSLKLLLAYFIIQIAGITSQTCPSPIPVRLKVVNEAGSPVQVFYIKKGIKDEYIKMGDVLQNLGEFALDTYVGHEFAVKFAKGSSDIEARVTKGDDEETLRITYNKKSGLKLSKITKFDETKASLLDSCKDYAEEDLTDCVATMLHKATKQFKAMEEELTKTRDLMASRLRNYTCDDPALNSSLAIKATYEVIADRTYQVNAMFDSTRAKIWVVPDFITPEECAHLETYARPRLHRAMVLDGDGSGVVRDDIRRANQAKYDDMHSRPNDPLWPLYQRVLQLNNKLTGTNLYADGQEDLVVTQYGVDDEYKPHCDGICDGTAYKKTGRIASAVMYCQVAEVGGGTSFSKADVFVKPAVGSLTFFSYRGADGLMDAGFTEHSGCPVRVGEKWITTLWLRDNVSRGSPWSLTDPMGNPIQGYHTETRRRVSDGYTSYFEKA